MIVDTTIPRLGRIYLEYGTQISSKRKLNHSHLTVPVPSRIRSWRFVFAIVHAGQNAHGLRAPCLFQDLSRIASEKNCRKKFMKINHETSTSIVVWPSIRVFFCLNVPLSNNGPKPKKRDSRTSRRSTPRWVGASAWGFDPTKKTTTKKRRRNEQLTWTRCGNGAAVRVKLNALGCEKSVKLSKSAIFVATCCGCLVLFWLDQGTWTSPSGDSCCLTSKKTEESQFGFEKSVSESPQSLIFRLLNQDLNKKPWGTIVLMTTSPTAEPQTPTY